MRWHMREAGANGWLGAGGLEVSLRLKNDASGDQVWVSPGGRGWGSGIRHAHSCCHWPGPERCPWVGRGGHAVQGKVTGVSTAGNWEASSSDDPSVSYYKKRGKYGWGRPWARRILPPLRPLVIVCAIRIHFATVSCAWNTTSNLIDQCTGNQFQKFKLVSYSSYFNILTVIVWVTCPWRCGCLYPHMSLLQASSAAAFNLHRTQTSRIWCRRENE